MIPKKYPIFFVKNKNLRYLLIYPMSSKNIYRLKFSQITCLPDHYQEDYKENNQDI